jgi:MFS family permease
MLVVASLSLLLLVYVGYAEGQRTYQKFNLEKITAQGQIVQNTIGAYLRAGLPLDQYVGFATLAEPMVQIEDIEGMAVYDHAGRQIFAAQDKTVRKLPTPPEAIRHAGDDIQVASSDTHHQVLLPLRTRFETVGSLLVVSNRAFAARRVDTGFQPLLFAVGGLSAGFALFVVLAAPRLARKRGPWLQIGYCVTFLIMAAAVVATLINLYSDGAQGKAKASASTLAERLSDIAKFNLQVTDFEGLDKVLDDYRRLNSEIREAALLIDGEIHISTDPAKNGTRWIADDKNYEYVVNLPQAPGSRLKSIAVVVPKDLVYRQVERSVRNFTALFIATAFLAGLFLQVASSLNNLRISGGAASRSAGGEAALVVVKPIFFLAVFVENLTYSFLPQFMQDAAVASGMSKAFASAPFTAYYLCFALSLIPAGHFAQRFGPKLLMWISMIVAGGSVLALAFPLGIVSITVLRGVAGIAQGALFIGIQSYILAVASPERKTQGAAIIVFGFQGGMISGMAIGSLLVTYLHPQGVFFVSGMIAFLTAVYALLLIPNDALLRTSRSTLRAAVRGVATELRLVIGSIEFLKTMLCIGVPAKAILTGTITFALPLVLSQQGYAPEEVGQIIMLYGLGVVAASGYVARIVDRTGNTQGILFGGAALSGLGLVLVGSTGSSLVGNGMLGTASIVAGVVIVGLAHGFINAPVVTHVAHSDLAQRIGANPVTTTYRFLERIGHVAGPFIVAQLFLVWGQTPQVIAGIGIATICLGTLFLLRGSSSHADVVRTEAAR